MSRCHTRGSIVDIVGARSHFLTFSFIFARFGRFGGFVSLFRVLVHADVLEARIVRLSLTR